MNRRIAGLALALVAVLAGGCTSDVLDGRAVSASGGASAAPQAGARFTDTDEVDQLLAEVRTGVTSINSYDYRTLDADRARALRYATGTLSDELDRTFRTVIANNATTLQARQQAKVNGIGVGALRGGAASLLVFGQLDITTTAAPQGRKDAFVLVADAKRASGRWLLTKVTTDGALRATPPGTASLGAALEAAGDAADALTSYRRATFDADFDRALTFLTGTPRTDVDKLRVTTRASLQSGGFDLEGEVVATAVESATGSRAVVLVSLNGYRVPDGGARSAPTKQNLRITETKVGARWLAEQIDSIGVS